MSGENDVQIIDQGHERKYFTMIPNIVLNKNLSPYALALYCRIKWRAGEDGVCFENTKNLAAGCRMSAGKVTRAKAELKAAGLIRITTQPGKHGGRDYHVITIVDIWPENMELCSLGANFPSSPHELASSPHELASSPGEPNNNSINKNPANKKQNGASERASLTRAKKSFARGQTETEGERPSLFKGLREHPAIQAIKKITGYYPRKSIAFYNRLIDVLGETPDIQKMEQCYGTWVSKGYNPQNLEWVFDWYPNGMYYVPNPIGPEYALWPNDQPRR